jgi:glycosyltransferase involved in cell wall biosynthesis
MSCRILYVVGQLGAGGLERQLCSLLQHINRDVYRPEVVVWNFRREDKYVAAIRSLNVPLHCFRQELSGIQKVFTLRRLVKCLRPELVHSYSFHTNVAVWWATLGTPIVPVGAVQSDFIHDMASCGFLLGRLSARWPRHQIYNNFAGAQNAHKSYSLFTPSRISVVWNGLDLKQFDDSPLPADGQVRILGVGSLLHLKRWDRLISAAASLKASGFDFLLEIAGAGPLREALEQQARSLNLTDRVTFKGHSDDVPALLANSTFLAHTSDIEGCPNVVMEAMACGRAVVATDAGDIPALIDEGRTGFVVTRGDHANLVKQLSTLISDRKLCRQMGSAARLKAEQRFGMSRLLADTFAAYRAAGWSGAQCLNCQNAITRPAKT